MNSHNLKIYCSFSLKLILTNLVLCCYSVHQKATFQEMVGKLQQKIYVLWDYNPKAENM